MVGNVIYLIFCKYGRGGYTQLQTLHATFDGAHKRMQTNREYWVAEKGFDVQDDYNGSFLVTGPYGFYRYYWVVTRTIDE